MLDKLDEKRRTILEAAIGVFARYGFKRASMEDIAEAAGMSRPALYQYFRNKTEIFRAGSEAMQNEAVAAAASIANDPAARPLSERLAAMLIAYKGPSWRIIAQTPHGREMLDLNAAMADDLTQEAMARARAVFAEVIAREAAPGWDAAEAARLLTAAAWSTAHETEDEAQFEADLRALSRLWAAALATPAT